jgi:hypothetical protein
MAMSGEVDPRLIGVLKSVLALVDQMRDAGVEGDLRLRLGREDGLRLLELAAGTSDAAAEEWSQRGQPRQFGRNSLKMAGLTFEWPQLGTPEEHDLVLTGIFTPSRPSRPANDNLRQASAVRRFYGFEEEQPILL